MAYTKREIGEWEKEQTEKKKCRVREDEGRAEGKK